MKIIIDEKDISLSHAELLEEIERLIPGSKRWDDLRKDPKFEKGIEFRWHSAIPLDLKIVD